MRREEERQSYFPSFLPFIIGMIAAKGISDVGLEMFLQKLKQYGPVIIIVLSMIAIICGIRRVIQGKEDYDADNFQVGAALIFVGVIGIVGSIVVMLL